MKHDGRVDAKGQTSILPYNRKFRGRRQTTTPAQGHRSLLKKVFEVTVIFWLLCGLITCVIVFIIGLTRMLEEQRSRSLQRHGVVEDVNEDISEMEKIRHRFEKDSTCDRVTSETEPHLIEICNEIAADEWLVYSRVKNVNPYEHSFLLDGADICDKQTSIVVLINSLHDYFDRREAIRETWGYAAQYDEWPGVELGVQIKIAFIFGVHVNQTLNKLVAAEAAKHRDVIQGDFIENYRNMTLKSLLGLKWVNNFCPQVKYLIKSDDDMVINFPYMLQILKRTSMIRSVMGPLNLWAKPDREGKWGVSKAMFPLRYYPPYESGSCYIISGDILEELFKASFDITRIFIDDVYITGILGRVVGITHINREGFAFWGSPPPTSCDIKMNRVVTGTRMTPQRLKQLWLSLQNSVVCH